MHTHNYYWCPCSACTASTCKHTHHLVFDQLTRVDRRVCWDASPYMKFTWQIWSKHVFKMYFQYGNMLRIVMDSLEWMNELFGAPRLSIRNAVFVLIVLSQYSKRHSPWLKKQVQEKRNSMYLHFGAFVCVWNNFLHRLQYSTVHYLAICVIISTVRHTGMCREHAASLFFDIDAAFWWVRVCECNLLNCSKRPHEAAKQCECTIKTPTTTATTSNGYPSE